MQQGMGWWFDDVGGQSHAMEFASLVLGDDIDLAEGILPLPLALEGVFVDADLVTRDAVDALVNRIHRTIAGGRLADQILPHLELDRGSGEHRAAALHPEVLQLEVLRLFVDLAEEGESFQVIVEHLPLLVGQSQELGVEIVEAVAALGVAHGLHPVLDDVSAGAGGHVEVVLGQADALGGDDFIGVFRLEHAILVDAGAVGEGVGTDDGLVRLHRHVAELADQGAGAMNFAVADVGVHPEQVGAGFEDHRHLFQRTVAGPLADAVDGALDLASAHLHGTDGVGHREAQIVVAVHRDDGLVDVGYPVEQGLDDAGELGRDRIAHGVRNVDGAGSGLDGGFHHAAEVIDRGAARILAGELHVIGVAAGVLDGADPHLQHVLEALLQLAFDMDGGGGDKGVDAKRLGDFERLTGGIDVFLQSPGEGTDPAILDVAGDGLHRLEIAGGGDRESHFHDIDTEPLQGLGYLQLLLDRQTGGQSLLTITQGGVEYDDPIWHVTSLFLSSVRASCMA